MKKVLFTICFMLVSVCMVAGGGDLKITKGKSSFLKDKASATIVFDWSHAEWNNEESLQDHWGVEYDKLILAGEEAFKEGFNENSKKLKIENSNGKYRFEVKITNLDRFMSVMSFVPGHKHRVSGTIIVYNEETNEVICEFVADDLKGGRDFSIDDSYTECMRDFGRDVAKY